MISKFKGIVLERKKLAPDVILLSLKVTPFSFQEGQFVNLLISKGKEKKWRAYSILKLKEDRLDLCIKMIKEGFASEVFRKTKKGDTFMIMGPLGHFVFDSNSKEHWFIGVGTGIVPLYCMLSKNLPHYHDQKFRLIFGVRTKKDLLFDKELSTLAKKHPNFTYIPTLTREKWLGKMGRVQKHIKGNLKNKTFYLCGMKEMVLETKDWLLKKGVDLKNIRMERYS